MLRQDQQESFKLPAGFVAPVNSNGEKVVVHIQHQSTRAYRPLHLIKVATGWKVDQGPSKKRRTFPTIAEAVKVIAEEFYQSMLQMPFYKGKVA